MVVPACNLGDAGRDGGVAWRDDRTACAADDPGHVRAGLAAAVGSAAQSRFLADAHHRGGRDDGDPLRGADTSGGPVAPCLPTPPTTRGTGSPRSRPTAPPPSPTPTTPPATSPPKPSTTPPPPPTTTTGTDTRPPRAPPPPPPPTTPTPRPPPTPPPPPHAPPHRQH